MTTGSFLRYTVQCNITYVTIYDNFLRQFLKNLAVIKILITKKVRSAIGNFHATAPKIALIHEIFWLRCQLYIQMCKNLFDEF